MPAFLQEEMFSQTLIVPSSVKQETINLEWSITRGKFWRKFREELEFLICCGMEKMEILIF